MARTHLPFPPVAEVFISSRRLGASGHPLLMLHGWGQSAASLQPLGELLASAARVHLIDLPGFGASAMPDGDWDTVQFAERVVRFLDEHGLERVDLLGHSFGARVAIRLASRHPERVRAIVLISAAGLRRQRSPAERMRLRAIRLLGVAVGWLTPITGERPQAWFRNRFGSEDYRRAGPLRGTLVKTVQEDLTADAARIVAPTLLLFGERDEATPTEMGQRLQRLMRHSRLITLPGKGHFPFTGEGAHLCAHYILAFLQDVGAGTAA